MPQRAVGGRWLRGTDDDGMSIVLASWPPCDTITALPLRGSGTQATSDRQKLCSQSAKKKTLTLVNNAVAAVRNRRPTREGDLTDRSMIEFGVTSFAFRVACVLKSFSAELSINNRN